MKPVEIKDPDYRLMASQPGHMDITAKVMDNGNGQMCVVTLWRPTADEILAMMGGAPVQLWALTTPDQFYPVALHVPTDDIA